MSILSTRQHRIYKERHNQLHMNGLAARGGRPYVNARLWRAPNETDVSWNGDPANNIVGRLARTASVDDAARVANKINQYIFKVPATRDGADAAFLSNCSGDGESINAFMQRVNLSITYGKWCWVQVDRAPIPDGEAETLATKKPCKLILWDVEDVTDWCINAAGEIQWIIVRSQIYDNADPRTDPVEGFLYTLYELIDGHVYITEEVAEGQKKMADLRVKVELPGLSKIPFVLIGKPDEKAWWYDGVENLQAQVLNLDSMHNETLTETVYPQLVLPTSLANDLEVKLSEKDINGKKVVSLIRELTVGRKIPILESGEDKGITRYIAPGGDLKMLTDEAMRKRNLLFDIAGLAMFNRETRQVQTAESKAFDQLDTNSTLGNRATLLQESEIKIVAMIKVFDPGFKGWEPKYETEFDVVDVVALGQALTLAANAPDKTPIVKKICAMINVRILKELSNGIVPDDVFDDALDEIEKHDFAAQTMLPNPFAALEDKPDEDDPDDPEDDQDDPAKKAAKGGKGAEN